MSEMYDFMSGDDLDDWEILPMVRRVLSTPQFGCWLLRRDKNREKRQNVHGEWIKDDCYDKRDNFYHCSECGRVINVIFGENLSDYPFCHCGADMRERKKNEQKIEVQ